MRWDCDIGHERKRDNSDTVLPRGKHWIPKIGDGKKRHSVSSRNMVATRFFRMAERKLGISAWYRGERGELLECCVTLLLWTPNEPNGSRYDGETWETVIAIFALRILMASWFYTYLRSQLS